MPLPWKGSNFSQIFLSDGLQLMHVTYANLINMHPLLCTVFHQEHSFPFLFNIKLGCKVFQQYGETPYINIFDARVASEDHRLIIRAWPTARAASCSKAWLHHLTHRYLVLFRLVYGVFFFPLLKKTAFVSNHFFILQDRTNIGNNHLNCYN